MTSIKIDIKARRTIALEYYLFNPYRKKRKRKNRPTARHPPRHKFARDFQFDFPAFHLPFNDRNRFNSSSSTNPEEAMRILVDNINPETTPNELRDFLCKYTGATFTRIQLIGQAGPRPGALIDVEGANRGALAEVRRRLNGMYWRRRRIGIWLFSFWDRSDAADARRQREGRSVQPREKPTTTLRR
nr:RNA-binding protein [Burkholderia stagnalis]